MYQQQTRYDCYGTAVDRFSHLAWRRNQSGKGLALLGRPQVATHSQLPRFLVVNNFQTVNVVYKEVLS